MRQKIFLFFLFFFFWIFIFNLNGISEARADTWEYVTHGGYDSAVEAWKRVALFFSSNSYGGIFTIGFVAGLLFLIVGTLLKSAFGLRANITSYLPYILSAGLVYIALIIPKDSITIYDEALNRGPYRVDNVPKLLAILGGGLNKIERGMIELIAQSGDPVQDYRLNPGGIAFTALGSVNAKQIPSYIYLSLSKFYEDCIVPSAEGEIGFTWNDLISGKLTFRDAIAQANNPSLYTVIYDGNTGAGSTTSCYNASSTILGWINNIDTFKNALKASCARTGYDPDSVSSYSQCLALQNSGINFLASAARLSGNSDSLLAMQQMTLAELTEDYLRIHGPEGLSAYLATQQTMGSFIGLGIHANSWIPELKEALNSLVIALSPLILIFLITPLGGRAVSVLAGMLIWLTMWGVIDAVVHSFGLSMAASSAKYLATGSANEGFGLYAASLMPNVTAKIYAIFGALRWSGLMLASLFSAMLVKFGGTALAMLGQQLASAPMGSGASVGSSMGSAPGEIMKSLEGRGGVANKAFEEGGFRNLYRGWAEHEAGRLAGISRVGREYGSRAIADYTALQSTPDISVMNAVKTTLRNLGFSDNLKNMAMLYRTTGGNIGALEKLALNFNNLDKLPYINKEEKELWEAAKAADDLTLAQPIMQKILGAEAITESSVRPYQMVGSEINTLVDRSLKAKSLGLRKLAEAFMTGDKRANASLFWHYGQRHPAGVGGLWAGKAYLYDNEHVGKAILGEGYTQFKKALDNKDLLGAMNIFMRAKEALNITPTGKNNDEFLMRYQLKDSHVDVLYRLPDGTKALFDAKLPQQVRFHVGNVYSVSKSMSVDSAQKIAEEMKRGEHISDKHSFAKKFSSTFSNESKKAWDHATKNFLDKHTELKEFLGASSENVNRLAMGFGIRTPSWSPIEAKAGADIIMQLQSKYGKDYVESLKKSLQEAWTQSQSAALISTLQRTTEDVKGIERVSQALKDAGLSETASFVEKISYDVTHKGEVSKDYTTDFVEWYAKAHNLSYEGALGELTVMLSSPEGRGQFKELQNEFLRDYLVKDMKKEFDEKKAELDKKWQEKKEGIEHVWEDKNRRAPMVPYLRYGPYKGKGSSRPSGKDLIMKDQKEKEADFDKKAQDYYGYLSDIYNVGPQGTGLMMGVKKWTGQEPHIIRPSVKPAPNKGQTLGGHIFSSQQKGKINWSQDLRK